MRKVGKKGLYSNDFSLLTEKKVFYHSLDEFSEGDGLAAAITRPSPNPSPKDVHGHVAASTDGFFRELSESNRIKDPRLSQSNSSQYHDLEDQKCYTPEVPNMAMETCHL